LRGGGGAGGDETFATTGNHRCEIHSNVFQRANKKSNCRHSPATTTKWLRKRPLHHGSLAARAPVVPLPRYRGGGCTLSFSRRIRARVLQQERKPLMVRLQINEGRRSAGRRKLKMTAPRQRLLPPVRASGAARATDHPLARTARFGRARLSALRRGSRQVLS
jgi:hypothetical protein